MEFVIPVVDVDNERAAIRSAIAASKEERRKLTGSVEDRDFRIPAHKDMWSALRRLAVQGSEYTHEAMMRMLATVAEERVRTVAEDYVLALEDEAKVPVSDPHYHTARVMWDAGCVRVSARSETIDALKAKARSPDATPEDFNRHGRALLDVEV